jgi:hypothetical protein
MTFRRGDSLSIFLAKRKEDALKRAHIKEEA